MLLTVLVLKGVVLIGLVLIGLVLKGLNDSAQTFSLVANISFPNSLSRMGESLGIQKIYSFNEFRHRGLHGCLFNRGLSPLVGDLIVGLEWGIDCLSRWSA